MDAAVVGDASETWEEEEPSPQRNPEEVPTLRPPDSTNMNRRRVNRHRTGGPTSWPSADSHTMSGGQVTIGSMTAADLRANIDHRESPHGRTPAPSSAGCPLVEDQNVTTVAEVRTYLRTWLRDDFQAGAKSAT